MPGTTDTFGIEYPCVLDDITLETLQNYVSDVESALATVDVVATTALVRPSAIVRSSAGNAYTAGVALVPSYDTIIANIGGMFTLVAPTLFTVSVNGLYLVNFEAQANNVATNTSLRGEILVNGSPVSSVESGAGATGGFAPPTSMTTAAMVLLVAGNTISSRITVQGVGNNTAFPRLAATLVSYGGS